MRLMHERLIKEVTTVVAVPELPVRLVADPMAPTDD